VPVCGYHWQTVILKNETISKLATMKTLTISWTEAAGCATPVLRLNRAGCDGKALGGLGTSKPSQLRNAGSEEPQLVSSGLAHLVMGALHGTPRIVRVAEWTGYAALAGAAGAALLLQGVGTTGLLGNWSGFVDLMSQIFS